MDDYRLSNLVVNYVINQTNYYDITQKGCFHYYE